MKTIFPGTRILQLSLHGVTLPRVHPNILGPGLAQFPDLDIAGSRMSDQQKVNLVIIIGCFIIEVKDGWLQGTLFFSILDTRKVRTLGLERCQLTAVNFVILATAVSCVTRANLSHTQLDTDQVPIVYILALPA